ncbi:conserved Plasmodium membrane protein, unknown function [Plasmodium gallinaceum]|uniref:Uncharacterized protein n=1 Tax=Plasmodium gallinaceum TaxID=5849 RepID=A0A1J1GT61_PLAGA|nr:conserved Plasmodium membrane protein, unknown function [Plasmodium gallinaceum]CRG95674.1 conserved Plasmodium membrane protein, unknown function [Plasmodium gallinaceum]
MLRSIGKLSIKSFEEKKKDKNEIFNKRIQKEIKKLKESKIIDDINVYVTLIENDDEDNENFSSDLIKHKYLCLNETFNESYFTNENFFLNNFISHLKKLKKNNTIIYSQNEEDPCIYEELNKYFEYKNIICPFFNIFEFLNFQNIFENFSSFLSDITYFMKIFEIFKNGFINEQNIFNSTNENIGDNYEIKKNNEFFTNIFFEILYKDFISHISKIQMELIDKILYSDEYENEYFYQSFLFFYNKYYSIKESIVYSFFIFHDYPFSKPYVNVDHFPLCILKKKSQGKIMGDKYNKKNILKILLNAKWIPKITLENLFEESKNFVDKLFFYYQYKLYLFYYYLSKHKIFSLFFENKFTICFSTYNILYSYVSKVDNKLITNKKRKNYSNLLYSINNSEYINQDIILYKFFYSYKKLRSKNYEINEEKYSTRIQKKKKYEYLIYLFFFIFVFFLPILIKSIYIYQTNEINSYLKDVHSFSNYNKSNNDISNKHPLFFTFLRLLRNINLNKKENVIIEKDLNISKDEQLNANLEKNKSENKEKQKKKTNNIDNEVDIFDINEEEKEVIDKKKEKVINLLSENNDSIKMRNNNITKENLNHEIYKKKIFLIIFLSVFEFFFFSLGIIYNLQLLRKKVEHNNFFINICSSLLILYNPILFSSNINYVNVISIGLLYWSINLILLKKMFLSIALYFLSIYFNITNISFFFPFLFIFVYINSRYIIKRGNKIKSDFKNKYEVFKCIVIYFLLFIILSNILIFILFDERASWISNWKNCFYFFNNYLNDTKNEFIANIWNQIMLTNNNIKLSFFNYIPFFLVLIFNYFFFVNTIIKFYSSLLFSSILFLLISPNMSNFLLIYISIQLLFFINTIGNSSILLNIVFSSYVVITNNSFNFYIYILTLIYFIFHIYIMRPSNSYSKKINYQIKIIIELIKNIFHFIKTNLAHLYEANIKNLAMSFVIIFFSVSFNTLSNEKNIKNIIQKKEIQKKIIFCLYSHINPDYLAIPLSYFSFLLFLMLGFLKLYGSKFYLKFALSLLKFLTFLSLSSILLILHLKRKNFRKFDFLSIPDSSYKRTFSIQRSKKL